MTVDESKIREIGARDPVAVFAIDDAPPRPSRVERMRDEVDATLRLEHGKPTKPPIATAACLDDAFCARLVARLEHRLDLVEASSPLPTGSRRAWRAELAVVARVDGDDPREAVLGAAVCDAIAHRLWSSPELWRGADESPAVRTLHAHVAAEVERVRARKNLGASRPLWAAALTLGDRLWLLGEGEAVVHLRRTDGSMRTTELHDGVLSTRLDVAELHGLALALGEASERLEEKLVATRLASDDRLDVLAAGLAERAQVAGGRRGAWIVARFVDAS